MWEEGPREDNTISLHNHYSFFKFDTFPENNHRISDLVKKIKSFFQKIFTEGQKQMDTFSGNWEKIWGRI